MYKKYDELLQSKKAALSWRTVYWIGAIAVILLLAGTLLDMVLAMLPGWEATTVPETMPTWFAQFADKPLLALRNLDLLNAITTCFTIPMLVALYAAMRKSAPGLALLALVVGLVGAVIFINNNVALPMWQLSLRYADAAAMERPVIEAAGQALLAQGEHGSYGAFPAFLISGLGTLLMGLAMLKSNVFSRATGWVALAGMAALMVYIFGTTFNLAGQGLMMAFAMPGGLLMLAWNVMVARKLFQLARE